ncbi:hypothetical protein ACLB2K_004201 [Fragaria x ananassa]
MEMLKEAGKMIVEGAGEAVLGSACESFLKSIGKCCMFDYPVLESVKSTVENLKEMIPKMEDHNMKLGDRQDEVKELKEEMERGTRLLGELPDFNKLSWFMQGSYNDRLVEFDASLKSLVKKLRLQSALDMKEVLVSTKENSKVVKKNTKIVKGTKRKVYENIKRITQRTHQIFELVERKTAENEELTYIPVSVLKDFRMSIDDGVSLLRSCPTILDWTDELKSEYTDRFRALENTLEGLYNRLAGIRPLKWRCGNCDKSPGTTSISIVDSVGFCH